MIYLGHYLSREIIEILLLSLITEPVICGHEILFRGNEIYTSRNNNDNNNSNNNNKIKIKKAIFLVAVLTTAAQKKKKKKKKKKIAYPFNELLIGGSGHK